MNRFSKIAFAVSATLAAVAGAAPSFAADRVGDSYHWEYTPGPRGTARWVADQSTKPAAIASSAMSSAVGHWRPAYGPRGMATWIPAERASRQMAVEQMANTTSPVSGS